MNDEENMLPDNNYGQIFECTDTLVEQLRSVKMVSYMIEDEPGHARNYPVKNLCERAASVIKSNEDVLKKIREQMREIERIIGAELKDEDNNELVLEVARIAKLWRDRYYLLADEMRATDLHQLGEPFVSWKNEAYDSIVTFEGTQYFTNMYQRLTQTVA